MASFCGTLETTADMVMPVWELRLEAGYYIGYSTIVNAELAGLESALEVVRGIVKGTF